LTKELNNLRGRVASRWTKEGKFHFPKFDFTKFENGCVEKLEEKKDKSIFMDLRRIGIDRECCERLIAIIVSGEAWLSWQIETTFLSIGNEVPIRTQIQSSGVCKF